MMRMWLKTKLLPNPVLIAPFVESLEVYIYTYTVGYMRGGRGECVTSTQYKCETKREDLVVVIPSAEGAANRKTNDAPRR